MKYSPKLKTAAEEIKSILKKYDIAGIVVLHTPGFSEYLYKINPTYSCAELLNGGIQFKTKSSHYGGDKKERDRVATDTSNMMKLLADTGAQLIVNTIEASKMLDKSLNANHTRGDHTSNKEVSN